MAHTISANIRPTINGVRRFSGFCAGSAVALFSGGTGGVGDIVLAPDSFMDGLCGGTGGVERGETFCLSGSWLLTVLFTESAPCVR